MKHKHGSNRFSIIIFLAGFICLLLICNIYAGAYNLTVVPTPDSDKDIIIVKNKTVGFYCSPTDYQGLINSYDWSLPGSSVGSSTAVCPGLVTYTDSGEGSINDATLQIDHTDENYTKCANPPVLVAHVAVLKVDQPEIMMQLKPGEVNPNPVSYSGSKVTLSSPEIDFNGLAKFTPNSGRIPTKLDGRLKIRLVQAVSGWAGVSYWHTPPYGRIQSSGAEYIDDRYEPVHYGEIIVAGGIGGAKYSDAPVLEDDWGVVWRLQKEGDFKVYLQFKFDDYEWRTIGLRTWAVRGDAEEIMSDWVGGSEATFALETSASSETPPEPPPKMNDMPWYSY